MQNNTANTSCMNCVRNVGEVSIEITHNCSLNCVYCSSSAKCIAKQYEERTYEESVREMSAELVKKILSDAKRELNAKIFSVSGGEPTVHPQFREILKFADNLGYKILLYTSGTELDEKKEQIPLTEETVRFLKSLQDVEVIFDFQGCDEKLVDGLMGCDGAFERLLNSIALCREYGLKMSGHFVPMRPNFKYIIETVELASELGLHTLSFLRFVPQGRGANCVTKLELTKREFKELQHIFLHLLENAPIRIRLGHPIDFTFLIDPKRRVRKCRGGDDAPLIQPTEDPNTAIVVMCPAYKSLTRYCGGFLNLNSAITIGDIWMKSKNYMIFRNFIHGDGFKRARGKCRECPYFFYCRGGCTAQRLLKFSAIGMPLEEAILYTPDPLCFYGDE